MSAKKPADATIGMQVIGYVFADNTPLCRGCEKHLDKYHSKGCGFHTMVYDAKPIGKACDECGEVI